METLRCTNCGSTKITLLNEHICQCQSCNSQIIMPKQQNKETLNLLNMAYIFRSRYDYDSAIETYKMVLAKDEDELSAYEGLLLAKYGIEYVYDQRTNRHIPTCHRANFKSIYEDSEYQKYLLKSNIEQRQIFEQKAREIDNLQKQIKRQIENEKDYDVFISYKATDSNGNSTIDSEIARDIYDELKARNLNVFFSEVELRNRLAANYESIIFHALQTSKIFILVGTKKEHVESVWVKNEWSRFFERMEDSQDTVTKHNYIPVFKNMNPYDMPKGNLLQGVDASQPGWIKRLGDGIDQLLGRNEKDHIDKDLNQLKQELENKLKSQVEEIKKTSQPTNISKYTSNIENYLKRVKLYIEENNAIEAKNYIKKILDEDVENAEAWFLSELINLGLKKEEELAYYTERLISDDKEIKYAIKYAQGEQKDRYQKYVDDIRKRYLSKKIPEYTKGLIQGLRVTKLDEAILMSKKIYELDQENTAGLFHKSFDSEQYLKNKEEYIKTKKQYDEENKKAQEDYQKGLERDRQEEFERQQKIKELKREKEYEESHGRTYHAEGNAYLWYLERNHTFTRTKPVDKDIVNSNIYQKLPENNFNVKKTYFTGIVNFYKNKKLHPFIVDEIHNYFYNCITDNLNLFDLLPDDKKIFEINRYKKQIEENNSLKVLQQAISKVESLGLYKVIEFYKDNQIEQLNLIKEHRLQLQERIYKIILRGEVSSIKTLPKDKLISLLTSYEEEFNYLPENMQNEIKNEIVNRIDEIDRFAEESKKERRKDKRKKTGRKIMLFQHRISVSISLVAIISLIFGIVYYSKTSQDTYLYGIFKIFENLKGWLLAVLFIGYVVISIVNSVYSIKIIRKKFELVYRDFKDWFVIIINIIKIIIFFIVLIFFFDFCF